MKNSYEEKIPRGWKTLFKGVGERAALGHRGWDPWTVLCFREAWEGLASILHMFSVLQGHLNSIAIPRSVLSPLSHQS